MSQVSRFCEQCGARLDPLTRFCEACGVPARPPVTTTPPPPAVLLPTAVPPATAPRPPTPLAPVAAPPPPPKAMEETVVPPLTAPASAPHGGGSSGGQLIIGVLAGLVIGLVIGVAMLTRGALPDLSTLPGIGPAATPSAKAPPTVAAVAPTAALKSGAPPTLAPGAQTPKPSSSGGSIGVNDLLGDWRVVRLMAEGVREIQDEDVVGKTLRIESTGSQSLTMTPQEPNPDVARVEITQATGTRVRGTATGDEGPIRLAYELSSDRQSLTIYFWPGSAPETDPAPYSMHLQRVARVGAVIQPVVTEPVA